MWVKIKTLNQILSQIDVNASAKILALHKTARAIKLYSYVPTNDLDLILEYGLASSEHIKNNPELLQKIFPSVKQRKEWLNKFKEDDITLKGPSVWFSRPDLTKIKKLDPEHPLFHDDYTLIEINYERLKLDYPQLQVFGLELVPYEDNQYEERKSEIEHPLNEDEILMLSGKSFEETWKDYIVGEGYFSPNVPHGVILIPGGVIPPQYLSVT